MPTPAPPRLVVINNMPTPYRVHAFAALHHAAAARGIAFEAWFMAESEPGRFWQFDRAAWPFAHRTFPGLHPSLRGIPMHANPGMWAALLTHPPTWAIVAGGWHLPNTLAIHLLHRRRTRLILWSEANAKASRLSDGPHVRYRRWLLNRADAVLIPGRIARETLETAWGVQPRALLTWPNLSDETAFGALPQRRAAERERLRAAHGIAPERRVLFWSARLIESQKGILNFLNAAEGVPVTIAIAGDGVDRPRIEAWIAAHPHCDVRLLGHLDQPRLLDWMLLADGALLPSFKDPNPLSNIEALWAGLPLITSPACGNWPEVLEPGVNGWLADPADPAALRAAAEAFAHCSPETLAAMGAHSRRLAELRFSTPRATDALLDGLIALASARNAR